MINKHLLSSRGLFLYGFILSMVFLACAALLEYHLGVHPCPLCILQRGVFILLGITCLISCLHSPQRTGILIYSAILLGLSVIGMLLAGRQIELQYFSDKHTVGACLPSMEFMLKNLPWHESLTMILQGSADCSQVSWQMMGLSLAVWSLLGFLMYGIGSAVLLVRKK